ncbi:hypothetical protein BDV59DRAFT_210772 [Aspergillus ambiguus]|uniref:uncharacterized protein n=1 Tax=Aspergillus ambiguus TaxID=176160 RepID=UPI003CCDC4CB
MAKTYLEVSPNANILLVDQAQSVGGTWASERLYPGLKTNNLVGSYEFSDFPMIPEKYGLKSGQHIPGTVVHQYFHDFAEHFDLYPRLLLRTKVISAKLMEYGHWVVCIQTESVSASEHPKTRSLVASKLVMATGLTSNPHLPTLQGQGNYQGLILHSKDLGSRVSHLASSTSTVVVGGNKSAWDACYNAAKSGAQVDMVIRPTGGGPSYVWPASFRLFGFKTSLARLSSTRLFTCFDPYLYKDTGSLAPFRRFLHQTRIGQAIMWAFWRGLDTFVKRLNQYDSDPQLAKLKPWTTPFWIGNSLSIHNYEDSWFDLVRKGRIRVHVADIALLSQSKVHLSNGVVLDADTIICCTGWKAESAVRLERHSIGEDLLLRPESRQSTLNMDDAVAESIYHQLPYLQTLPKRESNAPQVVNYRHCVSREHQSNKYELYRFMVPSERQFIEHRNLAFIGAHSSIHATMVAQVQALWITALFRGDIRHLNDPNIRFESIEYDAKFYNVYGEIRRPTLTGGAGRKYPDLVFDSLPYIDTLLQDLHLRTHRKPSLFREIFEPYRLEDYRDLVEEWKACI